MIILSKTTPKLALLALVVSGVTAHGAATQPVPAVITSKGGAQAAADAKFAAAKTAAAVAAPAVVKPAVAKKPVHHHAPAAHAAHAAHVHKPELVKTALIPAVEVKQEPKIALNVSGVITPEAAIVSGITPKVDPDNRQGYQFLVNNVFVDFDPKVKTDAGFTFSGRLRIDASGVSGLIVTPEATTTQKFSLVRFTRLYGQIESAYGKIQFGNTYGPQTSQLKGIWDVFYGGFESLDRLNNPINMEFFKPSEGSYVGFSPSKGSMNFFNSSKGMVDPTRANKIVYESPSFGGFKLSGAFTPRLDEVGSSFVYSAISATPAGPRVQNSWFIVPSFNRKFGDMSIGLMGSYGQGTAVKEDGSKPETDTLEDPKLWNVSADLQFKGFQIAGAYSNSGTSLLDKTEIDAKKDAGYGWNAVAAYNFDHAKIAVAYMKTSVTVADSDTADVDVFTAYADYKLADGVKILISENYLTGTQSKVAKAAKFEDTASNVVYIGFDVRF